MVRCALTGRLGSVSRLEMLWAWDGVTSTMVACGVQDFFLSAGLSQLTGKNPFADAEIR